MIFISIHYALFLFIIFILYWYVMGKSVRAQNLLLLTAGFLFYLSWHWKFLLIMLLSKGIDYYCAAGMGKSRNTQVRKTLLCASVSANIAALAYFKYWNFFLAGNVSGPGSSVFDLTSAAQSVVIPIGVSFYALQAIGYVVDVYLEKEKPAGDIVEFFTFISFFPLILAGPIERASNLLRQLAFKREFDYTNAVTGLRMILWGLFKKLVVADNCSRYVNDMFVSPSDHSGSALLIGAVLFSFQIYCDFSGYSDIAIGSAKLFNINLMTNFNFPYFSSNIGEFWRRWHISFSGWLFDYIFKPIQVSLRHHKIIANTAALAAAFLISGIWHGAKWTFIIWGLLNAVYFSTNILFPALGTSNAGSLNSSGWGLRFVKTIGVFCLILLGWIFFRADNMLLAFEYIAGIFSLSLFSLPTQLPVKALTAIVVLLIIEWMGRDADVPVSVLLKSHSRAVRWTVYYICVVVVFYLSADSRHFIYSQF